MLRRILLAFLLLLTPFCQIVQAQGWSYIYIQGDKQVPFYVKLEGEMLPRYSKNYCIIPQLEAGTVNIEILFQQNVYPAQRFQIKVPEDGYRGFLLTRKDAGFALYDLQQHTYLMPGANGTDKLPEVVKAAPPKEVSDVITGEVEGSTEPLFMPDMELRNEHTVQPSRNPQGQQEEIVFAPPPTVQEPVRQPIIEKPINKQEPVTERPVRQQPQPKPERQPSREQETVNIAQEQAVEEIKEEKQPMRQREVATERPQRRPVQEERVVEQPVSTGEEEPTQQPTEAMQPVVESTEIQDPGIDFGNPQPAISNSDCPEPIDDNRFEIIYNGTVDKKTDDKRILYLMKRVGDNCFTTRQASILASRLSAESLRYSLLKKMYPRIVDQQYFPQLDQLFKTLEWKAYFRLIQ